MTEWFLWAQRLFRGERMLIPIAPRINSTTPALKIHIMRISRLSSFWSDMAHTLAFWRAGDMIAEGAAGVNCDNYR